VVVSCEHGNEPSYSLNGWEFLDWLLKKDRDPWRQIYEDY